MQDVVFMAVSLGVILLGAELFTNGVEWLGRKLNLSEGAIGSVLAAVGTALPETMVPVIAIFSGGGGGQEIGTGAILGAPFMLGTLALFVVGLAAFLFRHGNRAMFVNPAVMRRDLRFFLIVYMAAILASFLPHHAAKMAFAVFLLGAYVCYVVQTVRQSREKGVAHATLPPCYFQRKAASPYLLIVLLQLAAALAVIVLGAKIFVSAVSEVAALLGIPVLVLALIITPVATELPEKFNSFIWIRRRKDTLALGNITGAMVFQSSVIPVLGILLTPWVLEPLALLSAVLVLISAFIQYFFLLKKGTLYPATLMLGGLFYLVFIVVVAWYI